MNGKWNITAIVIGAVFVCLVLNICATLFQLTHLV